MKDIKDFYEVGAYMRVMKKLLTSAICSAEKADGKNSKALMHLYIAKDRFDEACDLLENSMFKGCGVSGNEYADVFYGTPQSIRDNAVDKEVHTYIDKIIDGLKQ